MQEDVWDIQKRRSHVWAGTSEKLFGNPGILAGIRRKVLAGYVQMWEKGSAITEKTWTKSLQWEKVASSIGGKQWQAEPL